MCDVFAVVFAAEDTETGRSVREYMLGEGGRALSSNGCNLNAADVHVVPSVEEFRALVLRYNDVTRYPAEEWILVMESIAGIKDKDGHPIGKASSKALDFYDWLLGIARDISWPLEVLGTCIERVAYP